jgi:hypothetical protein
VVGKQSQANIKKVLRVMDNSAAELETSDLQSVYAAVQEARMERALDEEEKQLDFVVAPHQVLHHKG